MKNKISRQKQSTRKGRQKVTVSVYGIPILEDGITWDLDSKKVEDRGTPNPTYEEDQTLQPGAEVTKSKGSAGSRWETYKIVYKNGKEISRELDHKTTYKVFLPDQHIQVLHNQAHPNNPAQGFYPMSLYHSQVDKNKPALSSQPH